ncbi:MAG TPA: BatA domain-containing protein [Tepidisphaeraceae bacterium]|jgi:hypothetical protein|nr:BatA domain-containing protein [Tepidisphaeraceae bacterium]
MTFLNPLMLAGLGGALLPLVLHLLSRARYRSVDWGAMMFLHGADPRDRQSSQLKQYALLAMRMLIVALLALAMARPITSESWAALAPGGPATVVLMLDCSPSMAIVEGNQSRMEAAREAALKLLATLRQGDRVALLLAGQAQDDAELSPTTDLRTTAARIAAARPAGRAVDFAQELNRADRLLQRAAPQQDGRIFIVCDRQATNWRNVTLDFARAWRRDAAIDASAGARLSIFPVGGELAENVAVESVQFVQTPAIVDERATVEVRVRNYGPTAQPSVPVTLHRGAREIAQQTLAVAARETATARFTTSFATPGSHLIEARIAAPGLQTDDALRAVVSVTPPVRVLLLSGDERGDAAASESTFFRIAVAPYTAAGKKGVDPAAVTVVPAEQFEPAMLDAQQVLVLANVGQLSPASVKAIEQFVYEGGGLLIAPGTLVDAQQYNAQLWRDGAGILPAELQPPTSAGGAEATAILGVDFLHPALSFLRGRPDPIPNVVIGRYFPVTPRQPDATVAVTYASGRPFLVESAWGRGRVALMTTGLDADWSALPLSSFYLPFVQSMVRHLASGDRERNVAPGEPIVLTIDEPIDGDVRVQLPSGRTVSPAVYRNGARTEVRYDDTSVDGLYRVRYRTRTGQRTTPFVMRPSRDESDITPLSIARWDEISGAMGAQRIDLSQQPVPWSLSRDRRGRELWGSLLALCGVLLMSEMLLARRWSAGGRG